MEHSITKNVPYLGRKMSANTISGEWTNDRRRNLWHSLFNERVLSMCNEDDDENQGMAMLLATTLSMFKRSRATAEKASRAPCEHCPRLEVVCSNYEAEVTRLKVKAAMADKIQNMFFSTISDETKSSEQRSTALNQVMTQVFETFRPDDEPLLGDGDGAKRKRSATSPQSNKRTPTDRDEKLPVDKSRRDAEQTVLEANVLVPHSKDAAAMDSPRVKQLQSDLPPGRSPSKLRAPPRSASFTLSPPKKPPQLLKHSIRAPDIVLVPESLEAPRNVFKRNIVIPETLCSPTTLDDSLDSDYEATQMPFSSTPEKQVPKVEPISPIFGSRNNSLTKSRLRLDRSVESPAARRNETTPDVTVRKSLGSPMKPSPSLLNDVPVIANTSKLNQGSKRSQENVGGRLSLRNGSYYKTKTRADKESDLFNIDDDILEIVDNKPTPRLLHESNRSEARDPRQKRTGQWQLKPTSDVESIRTNRAAIKLRQTKLSLVATKNSDLCSAEEFNGGIRAGGTSTQIQDMDQDFEKAVMLSLLEAEKNLPKRFLERMNDSDDVDSQEIEEPRKQEKVDPEELLEEMGQPLQISMRTKALIKDYDKVPKKTEEPDFVYQRGAVRRQSDRMKLAGQDCHECCKYYDALGIDDKEKQKRMNKCSKHRNNHKAPDTPPGYWSSIPCTAALREMNLDVTQKGEPLKRRKPRRQL